MSTILTNKVWIGIALTAVIGALSSVQAISPTWGGAIGAVVSLLTIIGHTTNVIKGM